MTIGNILKTALTYSIVPTLYASWLWAELAAKNHDTLESQIIPNGMNEMELRKTQSQGTVLYLEKLNFYGARLVDRDSDGNVDEYRIDPFSTKPPMVLHVRRKPTAGEQELYRGVRSSLDHH